jgi:hypothetical protein
MPAIWRRQCHIGQLSLGGSLGAHILGASPSSLSRPHLHPFLPLGARDDGGVGGGADGELAGRQRTSETTPEISYLRPDGTVHFSPAFSLGWTF